MKKSAIWIAFLLLSTLMLQTKVFAADAQAQQPANAKITGGHKVVEGFWPWMVALLRHDEADNYAAHFCGGTLVHSEWVMTAASCFFDYSGTRTDSAGTDILIGTVTLSSGGKRIQSDRLVIHPDFESALGGNDIALLHLTSPVTDVQPVSLPGNSYDLDVVELGVSGLIMGWGNTASFYVFDGGPLSYPDGLLQADVSIASGSQCLGSLFSGDRDAKETQICGHTSRRDFCGEDFGGPMISLLSGEFQQVGILSVDGTSCGVFKGGSLSTRVSKFEEFINDTMCTADKPLAPTLSMSQRAIADGYVAVDVSFSAVADATKYRLYYAPYVPDFNQVAQIRHVDMGQSAQYIIPSGSSYYIAGEAVNVNCVSDLSNVVTVSGL